MGTRYNFICGGCGYEAEVSGGDDAGMIASTTTIECIKCRTIRDVVSATWRTGEPANVLLQCPRGKSHAIRRWTTGDPCPRCGGAMHTGDLVTLWD